MLTQAELKEILNYDPETGIFTWNKRITNRINKGHEAGSIHPDGRVKIGINGKAFRADRLAWLYMTGSVPHRSLIHKNDDVGDSTWTNLGLTEKVKGKKRQKYNMNHYGDDERIVHYDKCNYWEVPVHPSYMELLETMIRETEKEKANSNKLAERVRNSPSYIAKKKRITERRIEKRITEKQ